MKKIFTNKNKAPVANFLRIPLDLADGYVKYGVNTVMEFIAHGVSDECLDEFSNKFAANMLKSQEAVDTDPEVVE